MRKIFAEILIFLIILFTGEWKSAAELNYGMALRENSLLMQWPSLPQLLSPSSKSFGISQTAFRGWTGIKKDFFKVSFAVESRGTFSSQSGSSSRSGLIFRTGSPIELFNWTGFPIDETSASLRLRIENLSVTWNGPFDIQAGRQPLTLGTSHFISVLDVIAPFAPGDLDATYKPGVDALRIHTSLGAAGEAEIIGVGSNRWKDSALLGRVRTSKFGTDVEAVGGKFRNRGFGGIGWDGEIKSAGFWGEIAFFERKKDFENLYGGWEKAAFSGIAGIDFYFPHDTLIGAAFLHQDFGVRNPSDLAKAYTDAPFREGWLFLGSARYGIVTFHCQLHPLVNADITGIVNLIDSSTLWQPKLTVNISDNSDLSFYGWMPSGIKPGQKGLAVDIRSEFGMLPHGAGMYARWFF
jgi:hypothetical protein